jgi:hypothetical protein
VVENTTSQIAKHEVRGETELCKARWKLIGSADDAKAMFPPQESQGSFLLEPFVGSDILSH